MQISDRDWYRIKGLLGSAQMTVFEVDSALSGESALSAATIQSKAALISEKLSALQEYIAAVEYDEYLKDAEQDRARQPQANKQQHTR